MLDPNELNSVLSIREGIAVINLSEAISEDMEKSWFQSIKALILSTLIDSDSNAVVITVGDDSFLAKIEELRIDSNYLTIHSQLLELFSAIESANKPVIAAFESSVLDVTLEFALHCHYRVASAGAMVGFSSVKSRLIPGLGGTQLLPRLIGIEAALNILHRSSIIEVAKLADSGLFDDLVEGDVSAAAFTLAQRILKENKPLRRTCEIKINLPHAQAFFDIVRMNVGAIHKGNKAAISCVDCIEAAVLQPIEKGMKFEQKQFRQQLMSYLEHNYFLTNSGEIA